MTQSNNNNPLDALQSERQADQPAQISVPKINENNNIKVLNLRWQEIRKWELNRLRVQELNHHLAFMRKPVKQSIKTISPIKAKNDPAY